MSEALLISLEKLVGKLRRIIHWSGDEQCMVCDIIAVTKYGKALPLEFWYWFSTRVLSPHAFKSLKIRRIHIPFSNLRYRNLQIGKVISQRSYIYLYNEGSL